MKKGFNSAFDGGLALQKRTPREKGGGSPPYSSFEGAGKISSEKGKTYSGRKRSGLAFEDAKEGSQRNGQKFL